MPLLAASVVLGVAVTQAKAAFTYDLRVTGGPTAATNGGHTVSDPLSGDYTLQIWGRVTGDTDPTNDTASFGYFNVLSSTPASNLLTAGSGVSTLAVAVPPWTGGGVSVNGNGPANLTPDGTADWGDTDQSSPGTWAEFLTSSPSVALGSTTATSKAVNANTWEILIASLTVHVNGTTGAAGETDFNVGVPTQTGSFGFGTGKKHTVQYVLDGVTANGTTANLTGTNTNPQTISGVQFLTAVPEPASLGVLALGALALVARRSRK